MRRIALVPVSTLLLLASAPDIGAQQPAPEEAPPTLRLSLFQCQQNRIDEVLEEAERYDLPIWRELVQEGAVMSYGYFTHAWADEWNLGIYTIARDIPAILTASEEAGRRAEERHPDAPDMTGEICPWHRDGFYVLGPSAEMPSADGGN